MESRHREGLSPRHSDKIPCRSMRIRIDDRTERSVCGCPGERGVDCKFIRTSSRGDEKVQITDRAVTPATSGARAGDGIRGGKTLF